MSGTGILVQTESSDNFVLDLIFQFFQVVVLLVVLVFFLILCAFLQLGLFFSNFLQFRYLSNIKSCFESRYLVVFLVTCKYFPGTFLTKIRYILSQFNTYRFWLGI